MLQEVENFRKTGKRDKNVVNTKNILFIMSGAFTDLSEIIHRRITTQGIGFGSQIPKPEDKSAILSRLVSEDLIQFGFETEFVGRLPVRAVFERLTEEDLYNILKNPNNPIILGKKLDFAAYGIEAKFEDKALRMLAKHAFSENTGARGLVSAVESALLLYEKRLPSTAIRTFSITSTVVASPDKTIESVVDPSGGEEQKVTFNRLRDEEKQMIIAYLQSNQENMNRKYQMNLTSSRIEAIAEYYSKNATDIGKILDKIRSYYHQIKTIELYFLKTHDINIVLEDSAIDFMIENIIRGVLELKNVYSQLSEDFVYGLKLVRDKTGKNRFFITKEALISPETYISNLIKDKTPLKNPESMIENDS
jgi:hypothetical protein